jgi:hypothetical protein
MNRGLRKADINHTEGGYYTLMGKRIAYYTVLREINRRERFDAHSGG